jgi:hypothetical protein
MILLVTTRAGAVVVEEELVEGLANSNPPLNSIMILEIAEDVEVVEAEASCPEKNVVKLIMKTGKLSSCKSSHSS